MFALPTGIPGENRTEIRACAKIRIFFLDANEWEVVPLEMMCNEYL